MDITDTELLYSGGAGNTDQALSLGGIVSTTGPSLFGFTALTALPGISILEVGGMEAGVLDFVYDGSAKQIKIRPPDNASGPYVIIKDRGDHNAVLYGGAGADNGYAVIGVIEASLSTSTLSDTSTITIPTETIFPDVDNGQAAIGATQYRCLLLKNTHASTNIVRIDIYLAYDTEGEDTIYYAIDTDAGVGDGSTTGVPVDIVTEDNGVPLAGLTFESNTDPAQAQSFVGNIVPGQTIPIWVKRVVPAFVNEAVVNNDFSLSFKIYVDS